MTMAVGFVCRDGVVIGADRQVTGANYTFPECKIESIGWENGSGIFAYSGGYDVFQDFKKVLWKTIDPSSSHKADDITIKLQETLKALALKKGETFFLLFGFMLSNDHHARLLVSTETKRVVKVQECDVIGYGDSPLARSLLGRFKDVPHFVTVNQARFYAVDFVSQAKRYDGQFVGDGIDVYSIDNSSSGNGGHCTRVLDAGQTGKWEEEIRLIHYWMDVLFSKVTDRENPVALDQFKERLQAFRVWIGGEPIKF
jgi:20S proteasome alpha/beta subunit